MRSTATSTSLPCLARVCVRVVAPACCLLAVAGCGQRTFPVTLSFSLADGRPLAGGAVVVKHATDPVILGGGPIGPDGDCRPMLRGRSTPGLPAGTYRIGVTPPESQVMDDPTALALFDWKHMDPSASGLTVEVGPGQSPTRAFSLRKPR